MNIEKNEYYFLMVMLFSFGILVGIALQIKINSFDKCLLRESKVRESLEKSLPKKGESVEICVHVEKGGT